MPTLFVADPAIRAELLQAVAAHLPAGWSVGSGPEGARAILTENADVTAELLAAAGPALALVLRLDTGRASVAPGPRVVDIPNPALIGVAEHTVALILALSRHLLDVAQRTAAQAWAPGRETPVLTDQQRYTYNWIGLEDFGTIYRKTVGLVGLGAIGRAVAARLRPFGVRLLYAQRTRLAPEVERALVVSWRPLDDLLRESDVVSLHHRFQDGPGGNDRQFGAAQFALMRPGAIFVNTARGRMVDEDALAAALAAGHLGGAGLDVFRHEPFHPDSPLLALPRERVILTAHVAGTPMADAWRTMAEEIAECLSREEAPHA